MKPTSSTIAGLGVIGLCLLLLLCSKPLIQEAQMIQEECPIVQCVEESLPEPELVHASGFTGLRIAGVLLKNMLSLYR